VYRFVITGTTLIILGTTLIKIIQRDSLINLEMILIILGTDLNSLCICLVIMVTSLIIPDFFNYSGN